MASLYPKDLDAFREFVGDFDDMIAADLEDLLDVAVAIETELGVNPSSAMGTLWSRLFENGNISQKRAAWNRLKWEKISASKTTAARFSRQHQIGFTVDYPPGSMKNDEKTIFSEDEEDAPGAFGALQGPTQQLPGTHARGGRPWRSAVSSINGLLQKVSWIAKDGEGADITSANSAACIWGYILWNLKT